MSDEDFEEARARVSLAVTTLGQEWSRLRREWRPAAFKALGTPAMREALDMIAAAIVGDAAPLQREPVPGDVVQIDPESNPLFAACFGVVSEVRPWGALVDVIGPHAGKSAVYPLRSKTGAFVVVGRAEWQVGYGEKPEGNNPESPEGSGEGKS